MRILHSTAVGFNRKKKGQRSYHHLFCTLAQTGQVLDVWHRPGNVHDSNGAVAFIESFIREIRAVLPECLIEVRMDCAFFIDAIVSLLEAEGVEFTISVPFERFAAPKSIVEERKRWHALDDQWSYFETRGNPRAGSGGTASCVFDSATAFSIKSPCS